MIIRPWLRIGMAALVLALAGMAAGALVVSSGEAAVVTRFGAPVQVVTEPGLTWILPPPIERGMLVDRRLRTTASGAHGVLTREGLSLTVQAWVAWRIPSAPQDVLRFVRSTGNAPDLAAGQLRTLLNSSLETITGRYRLTDLVNQQPTAVQLGAYEEDLRARVATTARETFGIEVVAAGIERLTLPDATLTATVSRMAEERRVAAEERQAEGRRQAAALKAGAEKDARIIKAQAEEEAAAVEATARQAAAGIYAKAHAADPALYGWLRSLDTLEQGLQPGSRLVLSTAQAPFQALVTPPAAPVEPR